MDKNKEECKTDICYLDVGDGMKIPEDFTQAQIKTGTWWRHLAAGGVAGTISRTTTAPFDRLKVFLQVHGSQIKSMRSGFDSMIGEGGYWGLWRGNGTSVLKIAPETALKFMAYEQVKVVLRNNTLKEPTMKERILAGSAAGGLSQTMVYPLDILKTKLNLRKSGESGRLSDAVKQVYLKDGWKGFFRGYIPNILGVIPYAGIDLAVYETLKNASAELMETERPGPAIVMLCGTASCTCAQVVSYPLSLIRTRMQAFYLFASVKDAHAITARDIATNVLKNEGALGFYSGFLANFIKVVPAVSISYVVYENVHQFLESS